MKTTSILVGAVLMSLVATPVLAGNDHHGKWGSSTDRQGFTDRAKVLGVDPIHETVRVPNNRRDCWEEEAHYKDEGDIRPGEGMIAGSIIGGVVGSQVGKGDGRKAATIIGTIMGAAVGRNMAKGSNGDYSHSGTETRCQERREWYEDERVVGYRVTYRYNDRTFTQRMDYDPGRWLQVRVRVTPLKEH